jgi:hypothetical protein
MADWILKENSLYVLIALQVNKPLFRSLISLKVLIPPTV